MRTTAEFENHKIRAQTYRFQCSLQKARCGVIFMHPLFLAHISLTNYGQEVNHRASLLKNKIALDLQAQKRLLHTKCFARCSPFYTLAVVLRVSGKDTSYKNVSLVGLS